MRRDCATCGISACSSCRHHALGAAFVRSPISCARAHSCRPQASILHRAVRLCVRVMAHLLMAQMRERFPEAPPSTLFGVCDLLLASGVHGWDELAHIPVERIVGIHIMEPSIGAEIRCMAGWAHCIPRGLLACVRFVAAGRPCPAWPATMRLW